MAALVEFRDFCTINPKAKQLPDDIEVSFVPMQQVSDTGNVQTDEIRKVAEVKRGFTFFEEGDVLFAKITPCMENGKGGIAQGLKNGVGFGSTEFHVLHPNPEKVSSKWLYYLTSWDEFRKVCARNMTGSAGQKRVPKSYLEHYKVYLPPMAEQRRIAAVLDKVTDLITKRRQQLDKLEELVKARFVEMFGDIWETVPLSYYMEGLCAGKSLAGEEKCQNKVLKTGAVSYDYFDSSQVKDLPLGYEPPKDHLVKTGDVIISRMNTAELVGAAAYVWKAPDATYLPDRLWRAEIKNTAHPIFVWQLLIQPSTKESIRRIASGTSGSMKNISKSGLLGIQVKKVDRTSQGPFIIFVTQIHKSKLTIQQSLDRLEVLKKSLIQQYFG